MLGEVKETQVHEPRRTDVWKGKGRLPSRRITVLSAILTLAQWNLSWISDLQDCRKVCIILTYHLHKLIPAAIRQWYRNWHPHRRLAEAFSNKRRKPDYSQQCLPPTSVISLLKNYTYLSGEEGTFLLQCGSQRKTSLWHVGFQRPNYGCQAQQWVPLPVESSCGPPISHFLSDDKSWVSPGYIWNHLQTKYSYEDFSQSDYLKQEGPP